MFITEINFAFVGRDDPGAPFTKSSYQRRAGSSRPTNIDYPALFITSS